MVKSNGDISKIKEQVSSLYGQEVKVKVNLGRNRFASFKGKVTGIYPALFTVSPLDDFKGKTTYSYSEMLCGNVCIKGG
jgi:uncharacterized protein Veg